MIETVATVLMLSMFAIWSKDGYFNLLLKILFFVVAIALAVDTAYEMGYVINMEMTQ